LRNPPFADTRVNFKQWEKKENRKKKLNKHGFNTIYLFLTSNHSQLVPLHKRHLLGKAKWEKFLAKWIMATWRLDGLSEMINGEGNSFANQTPSGWRGKFNWISPVILSFVLDIVFLFCVCLLLARYHPPR
jgi:hypothetical protein